MTIKTTFQSINTIATQHVASLYFYANEDFKTSKSSSIWRPHIQSYKRLFWLKTTLFCLQSKIVTTLETKPIAWHNHFPACTTHQAISNQHILIPTLMHSFGLESKQNMQKNALINQPRAHGLVLEWRNYL